MAPLGDLAAGLKPDSCSTTLRNRSGSTRSISAIRLAAPSRACRKKSGITTTLEKLHHEVSQFFLAWVWSKIVKHSLVKSLLNVPEFSPDVISGVCRKLSFGNLSLKDFLSAAHDGLFLLHSGLSTTWSHEGVRLESCGKVRCLLPPETMFNRSPIHGLGRTNPRRLCLLTGHLPANIFL